MPLVISDTRTDEFGASLPELEQANVISYLGVPILLGDGQVFGTLCTVDTSPTEYDSETLAAFQRVSRLFSYYLELENLAIRDSLTGLYNRLYLYRYFSMEKDLEGTIMFLDLDGFKGVNDQYGHEMGDSVLKETASKLEEFMNRNSGFAVRLGGDEFILTIEGLTEEGEVVSKAKELLEVMASWDSLHAGLSLSTSIGMVCYPEKARDIETLLKLADAALYQAKDKGKNCFQLLS